jgi:hypothetical protein
LCGAVDNRDSNPENGIVGHRRRQQEEATVFGCLFFPPGFDQIFKYSSSMPSDGLDLCRLALSGALLTII